MEVFGTSHKNWAPIAIVAVCSTLLIVPWLAKNSIEVSNPFSPFLNCVFPNAYVNIDFEQEYTDSMRDTGGLGWKERLVDHTVRGEKFAGFLGPLFLLAPVALLASARFHREASVAGCRVVFPPFLEQHTSSLSDAVRFVCGTGTWVGVAALTSSDSCAASAARVAFVATDRT